MEVDEGIERLRRLSFKDPNPVLRQITLATIAMFETIVDVADGDDPDEVMMMYQLRIDNIVIALEGIPRDEWDHWCEVPPAQLIAAYSKVWRNIGKPRSN